MPLSHPICSPIPISRQLSSFPLRLGSLCPHSGDTNRSQVRNPAILSVPKKSAPTSSPHGRPTKDDSAVTKVQVFDSPEIAEQFPFDVRGTRRCVPAIAAITGASGNRSVGLSSPHPETRVVRLCEVFLSRRIRSADFRSTYDFPVRDRFTRSFLLNRFFPRLRRRPCGISPPLIDASASVAFGRRRRRQAFSSI